MLSSEQAMCAAAAAVACAMRYWSLRNAELAKVNDAGIPFKSKKSLSLKDMIVIGDSHTRDVSLVYHFTDSATNTRLS